MKKEDIAKVFPDATEEQIKALLDISGADIGKAEGERDTYKAQLDEVRKQLKAFEGVNVSEMQEKITNLQKELTEKDAVHKKQMDERDFDDELAKAILAAGGKSDKAIRALLDVETLKASKNRSADIKSAVETCQKENDYLFGSREPINNPVGATGGSAGKASPLAAIRAAMGLPVEK